MAVGNGRLLGVFAAKDSKFRRVEILAREWGGTFSRGGVPDFRVHRGSFVWSHQKLVCGLPWEKAGLPSFCSNWNLSHRILSSWGELLDLITVDVLQRRVKTKGLFGCKTSDQIRTESPAEKDVFLYIIWYAL